MCWVSADSEQAERGVLILAEKRCSGCTECVTQELRAF
jgi:Na+-translocating ferredoxin:NAD+ oxidoreductase RNF subunit RnfB